MGEPAFPREAADSERAFVPLKDRLSKLFVRENGFVVSTEFLQRYFVVFTEKMGWTFHRTRDRW